MTEKKKKRSFQEKDRNYNFGVEKVILLLQRRDSRLSSGQFKNKRNVAKF